MTRPDPPRFDENGAFDALFLAWGLLGYALWRLGGWLLAVPDSDVEDEEVADV